MSDRDDIAGGERATISRSRFGGVLNTVYDLSLALMYPQACAACGAGAEDRRCAPVCRDCFRRSELFTTEDKLCWKCGTIGVGKVGGARPDRLMCRRCDEEPWTAARGAGVYTGALRACVLELKRHPHIGAEFIELMQGWQRTSPLDAATLVVPVPLHKRREQERGFNQARVLAEALAKRAKLPFDDASLVRKSYTEMHRAGMDAEARRASVADAFEVVRPRLIAGESILLVDDVWTTGATAAACARPLLEAGARDVFVLTLARAVLDRG